MPRAPTRRTRHRKREVAMVRVSPRTIAVILLSALMLAAMSVPAFAQGVANSSLNGIVVDATGGVMPGAIIIATDVATGAEFETVANEKGEFNIPAMPPGT